MFILFILILMMKIICYCSYDKSIKTWIKNNNEYSINKIINNAHDDYITKK